MTESVDDKADQARLDAKKAIERTAQDMDKGNLPPHEASETNDSIRDSIAYVDESMSELDLERRKRDDDR